MTRYQAVLGFCGILFFGTMFARDTPQSLEQQIYMALLRDRTRMLDSIELAAGEDQEARMLIEYHRDRVINGRLFLAYAIAPRGRMLHVGVDVPPVGSVLIFPGTHELRARAGAPSESNFRFNRGVANPIIDVPLPERFTDLWFGVRTLHELRHSYDALSGLEPDVPVVDGNVSWEFAEGEVRAHTLEQRLLDQATDGRFLVTIRELAEDTDPPRGFPEQHELHYPNGEVEFERLDELFGEATIDELNTRWGSYNIAYYFAMCDRHPAISNCHTRFMRAQLNGHALR